MTPFVGRRVELGVLRACLDDARAGRPRMVLIEGPAGIGKRALLDGLATDCARDPAVVVLRASGDENEELLAYGLLRQLVRSAGPEAPQLVPHADRAPLADPITVGTGYLQFLDSLAGSLLVLIVDDVLWADRPSVQALVFALRRLVADRVLAVFAARGEGVDALPESLARLVAGHRGTGLRLSGLDEQELRDWPRRWASTVSAPRLARRLHGGPPAARRHQRQPAARAGSAGGVSGLGLAGEPSGRLAVAAAAVVPAPGPRPV